jgi:hypothetical protein
VKIKFIVLSLGILLVAAVLVGRPLFDDIISYFAYNKYEGSIEVLSPSGKYIAAGCHIIGGATTTNSTFVEIRSKNEGRKYKDDGLLFMVDNLDPFKISWKNDHELMIRYTPGPIYIQKFEWKDVAIHYISQ